jgi:UDP-glucose 4-epimerase
MHEILVSEEEANHSVARGNNYVIRPMLPELADDSGEANALRGEYSSEDAVLDPKSTVELLKRHGLLDVPKNLESTEEMLR